MSMKQCVLLVVFLSVVGEVNAWDDKKAHPLMTERAVRESSLSAENGGYLSKQLGYKFNKNIDTKIDGKEIIKWIEDGSKLEDEGKCRAANHFHNPLKSFWSQVQYGVYARGFS